VNIKPKFRTELTKSEVNYLGIKTLLNEEAKRILKEHNGTHT